MIVFISSVQRGLKDERDYLPELLRAGGHEPRRFEDFTARPVSSREACLAGVEQAEVYVLLLGEAYGEPMADTGTAPTEEEFTVAKRRGIPILVFAKNGGTPEERQRDFIRRVGDYQQGRFWKMFDGPSDLGVAVLAALREVGERTAPLRFEPVTQPVTVRWQRDRRPDGRPVNTLEAYTSMLEVHLSTADNVLLPVSAVETLAAQLPRIGRDFGLFPESVAVETGASAEEAWATAEQNEARGGAFSGNAVRRAGPSGIRVGRTGAVMVYETLPRDMLGTLVDRRDLTERLTRLLRIARQVLPGGVTRVVPAATIDPIDGVVEGDPAELGRRRSSAMRMDRDRAARTEPDVQIEAAALPAGAADVAQELAARLLMELRTRR